MEGVCFDLSVSGRKSDQPPRSFCIAVERAFELPRRLSTRTLPAVFFFPGEPNCCLSKEPPVHPSFINSTLGRLVTAVGLLVSVFLKGLNHPAAATMGLRLCLLYMQSIYISDGHCKKDRLASFVRKYRFVRF